MGSAADAVRAGVFLLCLSMVCPSFAAQTAASGTPYQRAARYIQQGKPASAIPLLQRALKRNPRDLKALNLMGIALTVSGKLEAANNSYQKALRINPKFYPALKNLALNELKLQRVEEARAHFEQVLNLVPEEAQCSLALAEIYAQKGEHARAVDHYIASQGLFLRNPQTILNFARSCFESNQGFKATGALELLGPEADGKAHFQAGVMLAQLGKYESAARQFEMARKDYPDPYEVGYNLTLAYTRAQNYTAAIQTAEGMIAEGHRNAELYNLLAEAYERSNRTVDAYNALRTATELEPKDENNYLDLVALGVDHRNYDLAFGIIEIGLKNIPNSYRLRLQRGAVLAFQGQLTRALEDFEQATKIDPSKDIPYFGMVMALMQTDQAAKAREILQQRLAVKPDDYLLLYALGEMQDRIGAAPGTPQEAEAVKALERSIQIEPNMSTSRIALGRMLMRRGDLDNAILHLERAIELNPVDLSPCYQLATAYRRKGNRAKAEEYQARFEQYKEEDRDRYMNVQILRLLREGEK
jgi:tetratricopeptide (TPR) repeat protein